MHCGAFETKQGRLGAWHDDCSVPFPPIYQSTDIPGLAIVTYQIVSTHRYLLRLVAILEPKHPLPINPFYQHPCFDSYLDLHLLISAPGSLALDAHQVTGEFSNYNTQGKLVTEKTFMVIGDPGETFVLIYPEIGRALCASDSASSITSTDGKCKLSFFHDSRHFGFGKSHTDSRVSNSFQGL